VSFLTAPPPGKYTFPAMWYSRPNVVAGMGGVLAMSEIEPQAGGYRFPPDWPPVSSGMGAAALIPPLGTGQNGGSASPEAVAAAMQQRRRHARQLDAMVNQDQEQVKALLRAYKTELVAGGLAPGQVKERLRARELEIMDAAAKSGQLAHLRAYKAALREAGAENPSAQVARRRASILDQTPPYPSQRRFGRTTVEQTNAATNTVEAEIARQAGMTGPLNGMGERDRQIPISALRPGEYMSADRLEASPESFGGLGERNRRIPIRDLKRGSFISDADFRAASETFALGGLGTSTAQGTWLSPNQVAKAQRMSDAALVRSPENFGGLGARDPLRQLEEQSRQLPRSAFKRGELLQPGVLRDSPERFGRRGAGRHRRGHVPLDGLGGFGEVAPYGTMSPAAAAQMYALQQQAAAIAQQYQRPAGAPGVGPSGYSGGERMYADPTAQLESSYIEGQIQLEPICDPVSKKCIRYADPSEVEQAIGAKIEGKSALTKGQFDLPGFYSHPTLGPWGVDPNQAYQYWSAQQAAQRAEAFQPDMSVWGSPGMIAAEPAPAMDTPGTTPQQAESPGSGSERF